MLLEAIRYFCTPLFWPIPHIISTFLLKETDPPPEKKAVPYWDLLGTAAAFGAALRSFLFAVFCIYGLYDGHNYPAFGRAEELEFDWMWPIVVRNIIGTWLICGFWDWWLYFGPMKDTLYRVKIVQKYPTMAQMRHDAFYTTLASVLAAIMEIACCHFYATGAIPMARTIMERPLVHLVLALTITHWRIPHFFVIHRAMHPWKLDHVPDLGKFIYKHVHALHHKSYNITAFSGTNMHPIESGLYYTAALMCIPLGVHPAIMLGCVMDLAMGAWLGHDGFLYPGSGDYYHELHHMHFDCNYAAPHVPLDYWVGVYASCKEDVKTIWGDKPSGRDGNDTYVRDDSKDKKVE